MAFRVIRCAFAVVLVFAFTTPAVAQRNKRQKPPTEKLQTKAKIQGMRGAIVKVEATDGGVWYIRLPGRQNVVFNASAETSWLRPGMFVKFTGRFDTKGVPQDEVRQLEVFNLKEGVQLGLFRDADINVRSTGLFTNTDDDEKKKKKKRKPKGPVTGKFQVAGRLVSLKGNKLGVSAGGRLVQAILAEKVQISVTLNEIRYVREGDMVDVDAWYPAGQKAGGRAIANRMTISAAKPLAGPTKKRRGKTAPTKSGAKKDAEKGDGNKKDADKKGADKKDAAKKDTEKKKS